MIGDGGQLGDVWRAEAAREGVRRRFARSVDLPLSRYPVSRLRGRGGGPVSRVRVIFQNPNRK